MTWGFWPPGNVFFDSRRASYRFFAPPTFVAKASLMGGSKLTELAECTTTSNVRSSGGRFVRSPSMTPVRSSKALRTASSPTRSLHEVNDGLRSKVASRFLPVSVPFGRTIAVTRTSGKCSRKAWRTAWPRKPVAPVRRTSRYLVFALVEGTDMRLNPRDRAMVKVLGRPRGHARLVYRRGHA